MSRELCKHGVLLDRPCYECQMQSPFNPVVTAKDVTIAVLEAENSSLRHELANAQQVSLLAMELMHMGEVAL